MARKILSFDLDGVLAEGGYTPPDQRTNKVYCAKKPADPEVITSIQWLAILYDIFIVSTRSHPDANLGARAWLHFILGLEMDSIAGVITGPSGFPRGMVFGPEMENIHQNKAQIVEALGVEVHFDDNPQVIESIPGRGVLVVSEMPSSQAAANRLPTVRTWAQIREFLVTPGFALHGSDGTTVVSPCTEEPGIPKIDPAVVKALAESIPRIN